MTDEEYQKEWDEIIDNALNESIENGLFESEAKLDNLIKAYNLPDENDKLFCRKRLALSILLEYKKNNSKVKITDKAGNTLSINEAIDIVRKDILKDYKKEK